MSFNECNAVTELWLPSTLQNWSNAGFASLETIYLGEGSETFTLVNGALYTKDLSKLVLYPSKGTHKTFTVEDETTTIGSNAFYETDVLENLTLSDNTTTLEDVSFYLCHSIKHIENTDHLNTVGDFTLFNMEALESFYIPPSLQRYGDYVFFYCPNLKEFTSAPGDKSDFFAEDGVLFYGYRQTGKSLVIYPSAKEAERYIVPENTTDIMSYTFCLLQNLKEVVIPARVDEIPTYTFHTSYHPLTIILKSNETMNIPAQAFRDLAPGSEIIVKNADVISEALENAILPEGSAEFVVKPIPATSFALHQTNVTLNPNENYNPTYDIEPYNCTDAVTLTSDNEAVAYIDWDGSIQATQEGGVANITAITESGLTGHITVTVHVPLTEVSIANKEKNKVFVGETTQMYAYALPANATDRNITWESSDSSVATVSADGIVTGLKEGAVTITASSADGTLSDSQTFEVTYPPVKRITLDKRNVTLTYPAQKSFQITATITPANAADAEIEWISLDPDVAEVDQNGLVIIKETMRTMSQVIIVAKTKNGCKAQCNVKITYNPDITDVPEEIKLSATEKELGLGKSFKLGATVLPAEAEQSVRFKSSDISVATAATEGTITAVGIGTAIITVVTKDGTISAECVVTVTEDSGGDTEIDNPGDKPVNDNPNNEKPADSVKLKITGKNILTVGQKTTLKANQSVRWSVSNKNASVSQNGVIKANKPGRVVVKATASGKTASFTITIQPKKIKTLKAKVKSKKITVSFKKIKAVKKYSVSVYKGKKRVYIKTIKKNNVQLAKRFKKGKYVVKVRYKANGVYSAYTKKTARVK